MTIESECYHKTAIVLNNSAITLLLRDQCIDAVNTLQVAIQFMKQATSGCMEVDASDSSTDASIELTREVIRIALDRTNKQMAKSLPVAHDTTQPFFRPLSSQDDPSTISEILTSGFVDEQMPFLIRIDPMDCTDEVSKDDMSLDSGMIIFNYGIAMMFTSSLSCRGDWEHATSEQECLNRQAALAGKCYKLFCMANSLIGEDLYMPLSLSFSVSALLFRTIVVHALVTMSRFLSLDDQEIHCGSMQTCLRFVQMFHICYTRHSHTIAAPSA